MSAWCIRIINFLPPKNPIWQPQFSASVRFGLGCSALFCLLSVAKSPCVSPKCTTTTRNESVLQFWSFFELNISNVKYIECLVLCLVFLKYNGKRREFSIVFFLLNRIYQNGTIRYTYKIEMPSGMVIIQKRRILIFTYLFSFG